VPAALLALGLCLSACGRKAVAPEQNGAAAPLMRSFALPAPSALGFHSPRPRGTSYVEDDLSELGGGFRADLPNNLATPQLPAVDFAPNFTAAGSLSGLAYCMYGFSNLQGYDRDEAVNTEWDSEPAAGSCWIGLADWGSDRWVWYPLGADLRAVISPSAGGPLDDYIDFGGGLLLVVVLTGQDTATLRSLRLGTYPPTAAITASPNQGLAPLEATLDGGGSTDSDGSIVKYEWDLDGDGSFEVDGGGTDNIQQTFSGVVSVSVGLRVTDDIGATDTATTFVSTFAEWNHTWGKASDDSFYALLALEDSIYAAGQLDFDSDSDLVLQRYSLNGSRLWSKTWDSGEFDIPRSLAASADGNTIFLAGYTGGGSGGSHDMLLQAWDTSGNLKWTRTWGGAATDYGNDLVVVDGAIYLCGSSSSVSDPALPQAVILRFSENGSLDWQRSWGGSQWDECHSACLVPTLFGDPSIALAGDTNSFGAGQMDVLYLRFDLDGNLSSALTWGDGDVQTATGVVSSFVDGTYVAGWEGSPTTHGLALRVSAGNPSFAYRYTGGVGLSFSGLAYDGGDLVPVGYVNMSADFDLLAGRISLEGGSFNLAHVAKGGGPQAGQCAARLPDGSFVLGGKEDNSADINWQVLNASATDRTDIAWESVDLQPEVPDIAAQSLSILPTFGSGTSDSGGGSGDMFIGVHKL
jgi:hypothetical protein